MGGKAGKKENTTACSYVLLISPGNSKKKKKKKGSFDLMCSKPSLDGSSQQANQSPQKEHSQERAVLRCVGTQQAQHLQHIPNAFPFCF